MERKIVQGKEYVFERVNVDDKIITFAGKISAVNPEMVEFSSYRPKKTNSSFDDLQIICSVNEFMSELKFLCEYMNKKGIGDDTFSKAFSLLLEKHIKEIGRLIDTDLYTYVDKALILWNSIMVSYRAQLLPDDAEKLWVKIFQAALTEYKNFIYITQYDFTNPLSPKPYLVKLTDFEK